MALRVAVIGLGMVAETHFAALGDLKNKVEIKGVFCRDQGRRHEVAARHGVDAYDSVAQICADKEVDAAIVLTPPNARTEIVRSLATAGKQVLLEKPIERSLRAAREIVDLCEAEGVTLGVVFQHRFREAAKALAETLQSGELGELAMVRAELPWWRPQSYYDRPGRGTYAQDGGGVMITQAIHLLDLMLSLLGPVTAVNCFQATTRLHDLEAEDLAVAGLEFANGAVGSLLATTAAFPGGTESLRIDGTLGTATLAGGALKIAFRDGRTRDLGANQGTGGGADPMAFTSDWHRDQIDDFAEAVAAGRPPKVTGRDGLQVQALIDALRLSAEQGGKLAVEAVGQQEAGQ